MSQKQHGLIHVDRLLQLAGKQEELQGHKKGLLAFKPWLKSKRHIGAELPCSPPDVHGVCPCGHGPI